MLLNTASVNRKTYSKVFELLMSSLFIFIVAFVDCCSQLRDNNAGEGLLLN